MHDDPLRIVMLSEHAPPGGVDGGGRDDCFVQVGRCLAEAGHRVDVLTCRDDAGQRPTVVDVRPGLRVLHISPFARDAEHMVAASTPYDVVHADGYLSGRIGLQLQERFGLPLVTTFHALGRVHRPHPGECDVVLQERVAIEDRLVQRSDALIAECAQDKRDLVKHYRASPAQIHDVPGGVDGTQLRPLGKAVSRRALGLPAAGFVVLQRGRLSPREGIDHAIRAIARIDASLRPALYVVVGTTRKPDEAHQARDAEIARLRKIARDCSAGERLHFVGARSGDELARWYAAADVFLTTPWYEPSGLTPLEAMACATPVIGPRVGSIRHAVLDGRTGYLVAPNDDAALAAKLELLARQPLLARRLGAAGLDRVRSYFTWEQVAAQLIDVFRWVRLARRRPAAAHAASRTRPRPTLRLVPPPAFVPPGFAASGAAHGVPS